MEIHNLAGGNLKGGWDHPLLNQFIAKSNEKAGLFYLVVIDMTTASDNLYRQILFVNLV